METFITITVVIVVGSLLLWSFYRTITGDKESGGGCGGCSNKGCGKNKENKEQKRF